MGFVLIEDRGAKDSEGISGDSDRRLGASDSEREAGGPIFQGACLPARCDSDTDMLPDVWTRIL